MTVAWLVSILKNHKIVIWLNFLYTNALISVKKQITYDMLVSAIDHLTFPFHK